MRKKIVAGNWKMNLDLQEGLDLVRSVTENTADDVLQIIAPPFIHLQAVAGLLSGKRGFAVAAQNCHHQKNGAFTGEVSAAMVKSTGATHVIIGHSERRNYNVETAEMLARKVDLALENDLIPIFCVGEKLEERNANQQLEVVKNQLKDSLFHLTASAFGKIIIAYEPVWAIGTGQTASSHQAQGMHNYIRSEINKKYGHEVSSRLSILYGGSCNPANAKELFACADVDGGLIGGASLKAADFSAIVSAF